MYLGIGIGLLSWVECVPLYMTHIVCVYTLYTHTQSKKNLIK